MYNRLNSIGKFKKPSNAPPSYKKFFGANNYKTWIIDGEILYPLADISFSKAMNFTQEMTPYTIQGRNLIHTKLQPNVRVEINKLLNSYKGNDYSIEYMDNRISRYSMKMGKCEITGLFLTAEEVHHYIPKELDGTDEFKNLRIIHKDIHVLIHALNKKTINKIIKHFKLTEAQINKINQYRRACNLEAI
jgi:RNA-directed DNA polymerase